METATPTSVLAGPAVALGRAHALFLQRRDSDAIAHARIAVAALPQRADAWTLLGILEQRLGRPQAAERAYREAVRVMPGYADAWTNLGNLLRDRDDLRGTLLAFRQAMQCAPGTPEPTYNLGVALEHFGLVDGALAAFQATIECAPDHVDAHWNSALALLRAGRFEEGFREYEWRFRRGEPEPRQCVQPVWDGSLLDGRTLLVWAEQGFGDALQFLRFVPEVVRRGGHVVLEVMDGLQGVASRIAGVGGVSVRGAAPPAFDTHVALMSLPHTLGLAPIGAPYLRASEELVAQWRARIATSAVERRALDIGLVWSGNPASANSRERSPGFAAVRSLTDVAGVRCFSLQKGSGRDELAGRPPTNVVDLSDAITNFDDTAALMANLDVVVTCDTAVAHLAGALGKKTFVMLPYARDWRHGLEADTSAWYPSMRLFRQADRGDWTGVVARVRQALAEAVAASPWRGPGEAHD